MSIDFEHFTPWASLAGGSLIGLSALVLWLFTGRLAGVSGVLGGLIRGRSGEDRWRLAFLAGLAIAPLLWQLFSGGQLPPFRLAPSGPAGWAAIAVAGLLAGFGTRMANGCTSGHGVCGLARLSPRSLVAALVFMSAGVATVFVLRHGIGG